jgi:hypothetical protein
MKIFYDIGLHSGKGRKHIFIIFALKMDDTHDPEPGAVSTKTPIG